jgi:hypothetical protein
MQDETGHVVKVTWGLVECGEILGLSQQTKLTVCAE